MQIRMGSVFYRDIGDEYVTKPFSFTTDAASLINFVKDQDANGGGDFPEAVDQGIEAAVENLQWSDHAVNRLLFLILDAPPHDGQDQLSRIQKVVAEAQQKGIRIIPVSASGIDRSTEFILRFLSVSTNSTYVFITNDSGIGNPHLIPTVGNYTVEYLNNLMVRLITKYGKNND
jgi:von Willebrand factor type A domain